MLAEGKRHREKTGQSLMVPRYDVGARRMVVANRGRAPMPVPLVVTRDGGQADTVTVPVDVWLGGLKRTTVKLSREPAIRSIEIDPGRQFPDLDRGNQRFPR